MEELNTVLVTGYSKAPQGTSMYESYKYAGIVLEINMDNHRIINADFTFLAALTKDFFQRLVIGYDISGNLDPLISKIQRHYVAPSQQAVIVALQSAVQRYLNRK
ncbi:DUF3870 domain-containing protein [Virgibacillus byunsanensis]|uniref:DUF3870 domain-containing protein n=1 Tax=Virgibacillus byunsanensis TaxID=570945 RepID=A0ABW3LN00_9BACI